MTSQPLAAAKMATAEFDPGPLVALAADGVAIADRGNFSRQASKMRVQSVDILAWAARDAGMAAEVERLRAENADLKTSVVAFCAPHAVTWARDGGLPAGHLHATHYDILDKAGARMAAFTRHEVVPFAPAAIEEGTEK